MIYILLIVAGYFIWKAFVMTQQDHYQDGFNRGYREKERHTKLNDLTGGFQETFTESQKKAILGSMFLIIFSDKQAGNNKKRLFKNTADLLGYRLIGSSFEQIGNNLIGNSNNFYLTEQTMNKQIINLSESQTDWYILSMFDIMNADGILSEEEYDKLIFVFNKVGITENRAVEVVEKANALKNHFNL